MVELVEEIGRRTANITGDRGVDHGGVAGVRTPLKICRVRVCFDPPENVTFFHSKLLLYNCKFHNIKDERVFLSKMEGKTIFSRRLKQFDGLT